MQSGADELSAGLSALSGQSQSLRDGTAGISSALSSLADMSGQLAAAGGLQTYSAVGEDGEVIQGESTIEGRRNCKASFQNSRRSSRLQGQAQAVADGASEYTDGVDRAAEGSSGLSGQIPRIQEGADA